MAEAYTVLARRYRSQTFDELVGQEAIAQTLKNAIKAERVAHAFLFTGTRGVGKTSTARILAKAINCPKRGKDGNPCGECETCKAIARGEDMDVIEIDGASNNSVDQVRELRQSAGIRPARSPFKIYIIDEVHMLSGGAFNALLKTLEEPPSHVKFIFATTDVHKVPATIISRCQRFDFKNIPTQKIAEHLTSVCKDEGVKADADAVFRIARLGNGSMRDALSILDRVLSLGEKHITDKILEDLLGRPPTAVIGQLVESLANGDAAAAMTRADHLLKEGMGVEQVLSELVDFLRNLMVVAACGPKTELLEVPAESRGQFTELAGKFDTPTLVHLIALVEQTMRSIKASTMQRPLFDALLVRLALSEQFTSLRELLANGEKDSANPQIAGQKKSESVREGAGERAVEAAGEDAGASGIKAPPNPAEEEAGEENIYEVMKGHMRRQKEELDARNAELRQQRGAGYGRPGPVAAAAPVAVMVEKVSNVSDLGAVWAAAQKYMSADQARSVVINLGTISRITRLDTAAGETELEIPQHMKAYVGDKIRGRIEEALRIVTGLPLKLGLRYGEAELKPARERGGGSVAGGFAAQRVAPEVIEAVKNQAVVKELMTKLGATVVNVEPLGTGDAE